MAETQRRELITTLTVLVVIVLIVAGAVIFGKKSKTDATSMTVDTATTTTTTQPATTPTDSSTTPSATTTTNASIFKDGNYTATGSYDSPGGQESITISVTLKDGVVINTTATSGANDGEAQEFQDNFISGYKQLVVGKAINSLHLSRVSGSSLTSQGFNSAISQIESQAQA